MTFEYNEQEVDMEEVSIIEQTHEMLVDVMGYNPDNVLVSHAGKYQVSITVGENVGEM